VRELPPDVVVEARAAHAGLATACLADPRCIGVECSGRRVRRRDRDVVRSLLRDADAPAAGGSLRALRAVDRTAERSGSAIGLVAEAHVLGAAERAVRAAAAERQVEQVIRGGRLVDESLLHLETDQKLERVHVVLRADGDEELADRLAVLAVGRQDRLVSPRVLLEERVDLCGGECLRISKLLIGDEVVLVEGRRDVRAVSIDVVTLGLRAGSEDGREKHAENPERAFSYHVRLQCYMYANSPSRISGETVDHGAWARLIWMAL
jgi:hypothetical protein